MASPDRFSGQRLWAVVIKEFIQLARDRLTFAMMVGIPIMQLTLFGSTFYARAQELLRGSNQSIIEVALQVGFRAQSHFSATFKRFVGQPPQAWRGKRADSSAKRPSRATATKISPALHGAETYGSAAVVGGEPLQHLGMRRGEPV